MTSKMNIIEVHNVSFSYFPQENGNELLAIKDVSMDIVKGDYIGVVGPNGGGKSTLIKLILGLLEPTSGKIVVRSKNIAYVGQKATDELDPRFPITVLGVVSLGSKSKGSVSWALEHVEMTGFKDRLIGRLSGGQQQRVFIARALAQKPEIIVLDEPTSGVDQQSQDQFFKLLKKLNKDLGITLIIVTHDVDMITREAKEIAVVNCKLVFHGKVEDFISHEKQMGFHTHA